MKGDGKLMSVAYTADAVIERRKHVTRRLGWWEDRNGRRLLHQGDQLTLCRKVMGRKPGEPIEKLARVRVTSVTREPLDAITATDVIAEAVDGITTVAGFIAFYVATFRVAPHGLVTRIEWRYLDHHQERPPP